MQDAIILYENGKAIGGEGHPTNASDITFDNTGTDLVSEEVESAIKEVNDKKAEATDLTNIFITGTTNNTGSTIYNGTIFYLNGTLVYAISDIANGATFTNGTNIKPKTVGEALKFVRRSVTGTTNANGQVYLGGSVASEDMISAMCEGYVVIPFKGSSGWNAVVENYTNGQRVANTTLVIQYMVKIL